MKTASTTLDKPKLSKGMETREKILEKAVSLASVCGLEDLSIGKLARATKLSKSGLFAHFKSKENLQAQIIQKVIDLYQDHVLRPSFREPRGLPRIRALFENWKRWIDGDPFQGGCIALASALEFDDRPGVVRDEVEGMMRKLLDVLAKSAQIAVDEGHFRPDADIGQFAFELNAIIYGYHLHARLLQDPAADARSNEALESLLREFKVDQQ